MFGHVARFVLPLSGRGDAGDELRASVVFVTEHVLGATHQGELLVFDKRPFSLRGRWPYVEAIRSRVPALERPRLDPAALLSDGRMLFLLCGYQEGYPPFLGVPIVFDPRRAPAFLPLTGRSRRPFPLSRTSARRFHDLPHGALALTTETSVSSLFHVESDDTVEGACLLDVERGSIQDLKALPRDARPHDSGHFYARGFGISLSDENLFGPPPWGSDAAVDVSDGFITITPAESGKPRPELTLRGPCANPSFQPGRGMRRVQAGRHGHSLLVLDGSLDDRVVVDLWELPRFP